MDFSNWRDIRTTLFFNLVDRLQLVCLVDSLISHQTQNYLQGLSILQLPSLPIAKYPFTPGWSGSVGLTQED